MNLHFHSKLEFFKEVSSHLNIDLYTQHDLQHLFDCTKLRNWKFCRLYNSYPFDPTTKFSVRGPYTKLFFKDSIFEINGRVIFLRNNYFLLTIEKPITLFNRESKDANEIYLERL